MLKQSSESDADEREREEYAGDSNLLTIIIACHVAACFMMKWGFKETSHLSVDRTSKRLS